MLTDISRWEAAARAHGEFVATIRPAATVVEVKGFINPDWLVEFFDFEVPGADGSAPPDRGHTLSQHRSTACSADGPKMIRF
jgi:hypothetical protein